MTEGLGIRLVILVLLVVQSMVAALLGFAELLPIEAKVALVVVSAGIGVALNQITSWQSAPRVDRLQQAANKPSGPG